jgi:hypothetical protein
MAYHLEYFLRLLSRPGVYSLYTVDGPAIEESSVDENAIVAMCRPYFPAWIRLIQEAFRRFDDLHVADPVSRIPVEGARAEYVSHWLVHRLGQEYGRNPYSPARLVEINHLDVLLIEGNEFCVGVRFKKLHGPFLTSNHVSDNQTELRRQGTFPEFRMQTAHVFAGWRSTGGLEPRLRDITLTSETTTSRGNYIRDWIHPIWNAAEGQEPETPQPIPLFPTPTTPADPRIVPRRPTQPSEGTNAQEGQG